MDISKKSYHSQLYTLPEGVNVLLAASDPLLTLVSTLTSSDVPHDVARFTADLNLELKIFSDKLIRSEVEPELIEISGAFIRFFLEQRIRQLTFIKDLALGPAKDRLSAEDFRELIAQLIARKLDSLTLVEFIYVWLKINPWIFIETSDAKPATLALTESQDLTLILTDKLYRIIKNQRASTTLNLLMGSYEALSSTKGARRFNLGSPINWLIASIILLILGQLGISLVLWPRQQKLQQQFYQFMVKQVEIN